jgi:hypothetical protein
MAVPNPLLMNVLSCVKISFPLCGTYTFSSAIASDEKRRSKRRKTVPLRRWRDVRDKNCCNHEHHFIIRTT